MTAKNWIKEFQEAATAARHGNDMGRSKLRDLRVAIYNETCSIVENGAYVSEQGTEVTLPEWKSMNEGTVLYSQPISLEGMELPTYEEKVEVIEKDCLVAARNLQLQHYNPVVLNMASARNPGGGVISGAGAQEENLFRRSNLFKSMYQYARYAEQYVLVKSEDQYPLDPNHGGVYTPNATVFRGKESDGYPLLEQPYQMSFVAVAGISHPRTVNGMMTPDMVAITKDKIRTIFRIALLHGHDSIVLGALGCGAFCCPPGHMASIFHDVIEEKEFKNHFKLLQFAILEDHNSRRSHNPEGNLIPFKREFDKYKTQTLNKMEYRKIKVTALNIEAKKAVTITADMQKLAKCTTPEAVKKAIEKTLLETKLIKKEDLPKLKYQGRKEVLDEWKQIRPQIAEQEAKQAEELNNIGHRIAPDTIRQLGTNEIFVFGSNKLGLHHGGTAKYAVEHFGAVMNEGHGLQGKSYAIDSMSGLGILGEEVKTFAEFAKKHPEKKFLVTAIGCGIAGYHPSDIAPLFECCRDIENISMPACFWDIIGAPESE